MSDRIFWRDRVTFTRRTQTGLDPDTQLPVYGDEVVLDEEPCDLILSTKRRGVETNSGTAYQNYTEYRLKLHPDDEEAIPDENDEILVNGVLYSVLNSRTYRDPGSGRSTGTSLLLDASSTVDTPPAVIQGDV